MVKIKTSILSLGGSLIVPEDIDVEFLRKFRLLVLKYIKKENRIAILCGGGKVCRNYQDAAKKIVDITHLDADLIGIMATRLNAEFVRAIFSEYAYEKVIYNPTEKIKTSKKILIGAGWLPGCTTDNDSVLLAENLKAKTVINLTNVDYVYDKDPRKFKDAKPITEVSWKKYIGIIENKYKPGMNVPFDPIASKKAQKLKLKVIILNGKNLKNLEKCLKGKVFNGTVIS